LGCASVGKSTFINAIKEKYLDDKKLITTSDQFQTTMDFIKVYIDEDNYIIDTPGLVNRGNIINYVDNSLLKKINPKKEIKPKTYQIKSGQCLVVGDLFRIDYVEGGKNSFTLYVSNDLKVKRYNMNKCTLLKDHPKTTYDVGYHKDFVIDGLGFIKIVVACKVDVYVDINVNVFERDSVI
jgi:ribosome biogenesis GTPase A